LNLRIARVISKITTTYMKMVYTTENWWEWSGYDGVKGGEDVRREKRKRGREKGRKEQESNIYI